MSRNPVKDILERVLDWPTEDQAKLARIIRDIEEWRSADGLSEEEWQRVEERSERRELAPEGAVENVFAPYRDA
jgi:hypothetical protein